MILRALIPLNGLDVGLYYPASRPTPLPREELADAHVLLIPGSAPWGHREDTCRSLLDGGSRSAVIWGPDAFEWEEDLDYVHTCWRTPEEERVACVAVHDEPLEAAAELFAAMLTYGEARRAVVICLSEDLDPVDLGMLLRRANAHCC